MESRGICDHIEETEGFLKALEPVVRVLLFDN